MLPPTIQALLAARLQRLGPGAGSVLARAAIVGKDFGVQAVRELLPPEARDPLNRNLQTLVAKGLVQQGPPGTSPVEQYSFHHILIQQAAYRAIPKSLRAELHHRFADWLEYVTPNLSRSARRSSVITSNSPSAIATNCGPPKPRRPRCRSGRPRTSRRPGAPRTTAATPSRR